MAFPVVKSKRVDRFKPDLSINNMSKVVVVRWAGTGLRKRLERNEYKKLLEVGLRTLSSARTVLAALKVLLPDGKVGMKTNCLAGKLNSTPVALTEALGDILEDAGRDANDIVVWERTCHELERAGYTLNAASFGRRCLGTDTEGVGYKRSFFSSGDVSSLVSRILVDMVDCNINLPILKDHSLAGLSGGLKNMYGAINNPNKYHDNNCDPFAAHVSNLKPIVIKNRLIITDAIKVQYELGPGYSAEHLEYYNGLILSSDTVAADRIGLELLKRFRSANGIPPLEKAGRPVKYLASAQKLGLGVADLDRINLCVLTVDDRGHVETGEF